MAAASAEVSADGDHAVLRNDDRGIPRCLPLLAALVEANALRNAAAAASRPAESDLARAFRGGARPAVQIGEFLERIHTFIQLQSVRHVIQLRARLPMKWTPVFETSSDGAIRAKEMADLERRFLRAVDYRLFVKDEEFEWFCGILETAPTSVGCSCGKGGRKRTAAESVEGEEQDERRRVRACVPPPAVVAN
uniref:Uncharacterized protein n=1 Tax=Oryza brachyantha TaxID=4533 RepID=J3MW15_ORYBR